MKNNMHIMLDLETMGNKSNSVITQISAVEFDINTGKTYRKFNEFVNIQSCFDAGLKANGDTIHWWLEQSKEAQKKYTSSKKVSIEEALNNLSEFINNIDYKVWGNSNRFDCGILENAYDACKIKYPFKFWNELDVRTIVFLKPKIKWDCKFEGIEHNGIDDCKHQIKFVCEIYKSLNLK